MNSGLYRWPGHGGHVHGRGAGHAVGRALDQGVEGQRGVEPVAQAVGSGFFRRKAGVGCSVKCRDGGRCIRPGNAFPGGERQLHGHGLAVDLLQQGGNPAGILRAHPVELEAVGHVHRGAGEVVGDLGGQRLDPGVELLLGQFLCQLVEAGLPEAVSRSLRRLRIGSGVVSLGHYGCRFLWIVIIGRAPDSTLSRTYPHAGKSLWTGGPASISVSLLLPGVGNFAIIAGFPESVQGNSDTEHPKDRS
jgi:hypothetical protein